MNKSTMEEETTDNHDTTDRRWPRNTQKETIVLPRITEDFGLVSTLRTFSLQSLSDISSHSPLMENNGDELRRNSDEFKLPTLVLPIKKEDEILEGDTRNDVNEKKFPKIKQSEFYEEELKNLKTTMKQLCNEGRDLLLDYRVKEDEAKKRANQEKKAARNAANRTDKETTFSQNFAGAAKTVFMKKGLLSSLRMRKLQDLEEDMNEMQINDYNIESNKNIEEAVNDRDINEDSISAIDGDDDKSFDYSAHSKTGRPGSVRDVKKNCNYVGGEKGEDKKDKKMEGNNMKDSESERTEKFGKKSSVAPDENLEPSQGNNRVPQVKEKRKKTRKKMTKKVKEKEGKGHDNGKEERQIVRKTKENHLESPENSGDMNHDLLSFTEKNFEDEKRDSPQPLRILGQLNIDHVEQEKLIDLESVESTVADRSTGLSRTPSVTGLIQTKIQDKKWLMERFRVPKEPMEVAFHLQKCGFEYESVLLRDIVMSRKKVEANLKKAIIKEKNEQKRLEREVKERENKKEYERKMGEIIAMEIEQEAKEKEQRRAKALEKRKSNLELLKNINHTILSTKTTPSFRFSYEPVLPQPVVAVSPSKPGDKSDSDVSESGEEHAQIVTGCACKHSGRSGLETLDCKFKNTARTSNRK